MNPKCLYLWIAIYGSYASFASLLIILLAKSDYLTSLDLGFYL